MDTARVPEQVDAPAWTLRVELPVDLDQIHELHRAAFPGPTEAELVDAVRGSTSFVPELSMVAITADGSVLGHVLISLVGLEPEGDGQRRDVLALAPLAVHPAHAGRGIGSALTEAVLAAADLRDEPFVAVLGPPSFYGRFGFRPAAEFGVTGPWDRADAFQLRPRYGSAEAPAGRVVYPAAFEGL